MTGHFSPRTHAQTGSESVKRFQSDALLLTGWCFLRVWSLHKYFQKIKKNKTEKLQWKQLHICWKHVHEQQSFGQNLMLPLQQRSLNWADTEQLPPANVHPLQALYTYLCCKNTSFISNENFLFGPDNDIKNEQGACLPALCCDLLQCLSSWTVVWGPHSEKIKVVRLLAFTFQKMPGIQYEESSLHSLKLWNRGTILSSEARIRWRSAWQGDVVDVAHSENMTLCKCMPSKERKHNAKKTHACHLQSSWSKINAQWLRSDLLDILLLPWYVLTNWNRNSQFDDPQFITLRKRHWQDAVFEDFSSQRCRWSCLSVSRYDWGWNKSGECSNIRIGRRFERIFLIHCEYKPCMITYYADLPIGTVW